MISLEQIESFHQFAAEQVRSGTDAACLSDLLDLWEVQNITVEEQDENIAAIRASVEDMESGETGRDAREIIKELHGQLGSHASQ